MYKVKKLASTAMLRQYFGMKEGQKLNEFVAEVKELGDDEKRELAHAAAAQLTIDTGVEHVVSD